MERTSAFSGLRCVTCGRQFAPDEVLYTCPSCGPLTGTLDVLYDREWLAGRFSAAVLANRSEPSLWRYREILPIRDAGARPYPPVGMSPLGLVPESLLGGLAAPSQGDASVPLPARLWIKDDTRHPSCSSKDRASTVALARARELGVSVVAAASTGNAASSLATLAAPAGMECLIFAPATAPAAKLVQIRIHGARLFTVDGTYDQAFDLCAELCAASGIYSRNTATNPVLGEGKKTIALEIWEQLGFRVPDAVVVPVGDGCILGGVAKGFHDLLDLDLIPRLPRLIGVQAEGSAALANAWRAGKSSCDPVAASTVADSISVSQPRDQVKALRAVRESAGTFVVVSDEAILAAMSALASRLGLFAEPAAAAAFAGVRQGVLDGVIATDEEVVVVVTGHGLKDIAAARRAAEWNPPIRIGAGRGELEKIRRLVEEGWS